MNIIEELVKKYNGKYSEEVAKGMNYPNGKYTFHPKKGLIEIDGTKISVNIKAVGGASETAEPYRIMLILDKDYGISPLEIFPKSNWKKFVHLILPNNSLNIPREVNKQFSFKGEDTLIKNLTTDSFFCRMISGEKVYILIGKKYPQHIVMTPAYGIDHLDHFEKLLNLLKLIESKVKGKSP